MKVFKDLCIRSKIYVHDSKDAIFFYIHSVVREISKKYLQQTNEPMRYRVQAPHYNNAKIFRSWSLTTDYVSGLIVQCRNVVKWRES